MHMDWCKVSFVGKLDDGTVFEDIHSMELHLGDNEVVQGLDMAIALMNLGETAEIKVNARFAYGEMGLKSETDNTIIVPPNATVCKRISSGRANELYRHQFNDMVLTRNVSLPGHLRCRTARL